MYMDSLLLKSSHRRERGCLPERGDNPLAPAEARPTGPRSYPSAVRRTLRGRAHRSTLGPHHALPI